MKKKNKVKKFFLILLVVLLILNIYLMRYKIISLISSPKKVSLNLTTEEKLEDFRYYYDTIVTSVPMIDEYEDHYGISFRDRKSYYEDLICKTKDDYEFFCIMKAISRDVPSFHFDIVDPKKVDDSLGCYNIQSIVSSSRTMAYNEYWDELIESRKDNNCSIISFIYIDGSYVLDSKPSALVSNCNPIKLVKVNDLLVDDYICESVLSYPLWYDGNIDKSCRTRVVFNDTFGEKIELTLETNDGVTFTQNVYYSVCIEDAYSRQINSTDETSNYEIFELEDCSYIAVNNMDNSDGAKLKDELKQLNSNNVILDLRRNCGGRGDFASKYIYSSLYSQNLRVSNYWYIPRSNANKKIFNEVTDWLVIFPRKSNDSPYEQTFSDCWRSKTTREYYGKSDEEKKVLILVSHSTGSAADRFVSDMSTNDLAIVIGNNTGGEGLAGSFNAMCLPNSQLVFIYMPGGAKNPDGTDNSVYGTVPDYYASQSMEDYWAYINAGCPQNLEEKLKYDTVFMYAYNLVKSEE